MDEETIYRWASGVVFTLIGFPLCFFGLLWWKVNSWILGGMTGWLLGSIIQRIWIGEDVTSQATQWIVLSVIIALTIAIMLLFYFFPKFAAGILGASLGLLLTNMMFQVVLATNGNKGWDWWISIVV
jgi:hypothetical protein